MANPEGKVYVADPKLNAVTNTGGYRIMCRKFVSN